jgi:subtilisin family serine protease
MTRRGTAVLVAILVVAGMAGHVGATDALDGGGVETGPGSEAVVATGEPAGATASNATVEVLVSFENASALAAARESGLVGRNGGAVLARSETPPLLTARLPSARLAAVAASPHVRRVERTGPVRTVGQTAPWSIGRMEAREAAAEAGTAQQDVQVAIVDTGVDGDHPDLEVSWGVNTTASGGSLARADTDDTDGHGTAAAGIVAARNNSVGSLGVAPGVEVYAIKVLESDEGTVTDIVEGIYRAIRGPDGIQGTPDDPEVLSVSLGTERDIQELHEAVRAAHVNGVVVVAAAGNSGDDDTATDDVLYPAAYPEAIAVGAVDRDDDLAAFGGQYSADGPALAVTAPGAAITTTALGSGTARFSGTSAATPQAAGVAALSLAVTPGESPDEVADRLRATALDVGPAGRDDRYGTGRLRADAAVGNPFPGGLPTAAGTTLYAPTDPDDDGVYEDVNGDGRVTFDDVVALAFADFGSVSADPDQRAALDVNADGAVTFDDAIALAFVL